MRDISSADLAKLKYCKRTGSRSIDKGVMESPSHDEETLVGQPDLAIPVDLALERFPQCIVWAPLPVVSWLAPFYGHVGVSRGDGTILDFAGSYLVNVGSLSFGSTARYIQLDEKQCCFPPHLSGHTCKSSYEHTQLGTATSWDDGLHSCMRHYQSKSYNLFTCNSHSFVANFLNKVAYQGSVKWNIITIVLLVVLSGEWVSKGAIARSFAPFTLVMCIGLLLVGWPFLAGWAFFESLLLGWFAVATYSRSGLIDC